MKLLPKDKKRLLAAAMGTEKSDYAIENVQYVNVFTGEIYPAAVYVQQGFVAHVEHFAEKADPALALEVLDGQGKILIPGFIDAHIHIESSMLVPRRFAEAVVPWGTTTVITDPHEIANVYGEEGVRYMHENADDVPMRQLIDIPSCVPAVPGLENAGATFDADTIRRLSTLPRVIGLAEVMDFVGVAQGDDRMLDIIAAAEECGLYIQGHAPVDAGRLLSAYTAAGPRTCHETRSAANAAAKMRSGMFVDARESSISKDLKEILAGVGAFRYKDRLCLCTDDRECDDILVNGHMNLVVRTAVEYGLDPVDAVRCATLNTAREANIENLGAIAPGYAADMLLVDDLVHFGVDTVFFGGTVVAKKGELTVPILPKQFPLEQRNSLDKLPALSPAFFGLPAPAGAGDRVNVNVLKYGSFYSSATTYEKLTLPVRNGMVDISGREELCYVTIINRYGAGTVTRGIAMGFGLKSGADASTVSHDCHNLCVVYKDPQSAYVACQALRECGGGMCCVNGGEVVLLPLPVGGLMSPLPAAEVSRQGKAMKAALGKAGLPQENPLLRIATMALPVIPVAKFSDMGLVEVLTKTFIPIFPDFA